MKIVRRNTHMALFGLRISPNESQSTRLSIGNPPRPQIPTQKFKNRQKTQIRKPENRPTVAELLPSTVSNASFWSTVLHLLQESAIAVLRTSGPDQAPYVRGVACPCLLCGSKMKTLQPVVLAMGHFRTIPFSRCSK